MLHTCNLEECRKHTEVQMKIIVNCLEKQHHLSKVLFINVWISKVQLKALLSNKNFYHYWKFRIAEVLSMKNLDRLDPYSDTLDENDLQPSS